MIRRSVAPAEGIVKTKIASAAQPAMRKRALRRRHRSQVATTMVAAQTLKLKVNGVGGRGIAGRFIFNRLVRKCGLFEVIRKSRSQRMPDRTPNSSEGMVVQFLVLAREFVDRVLGESPKKQNWFRCRFESRHVFRRAARACDDVGFDFVMAAPLQIPTFHHVSTWRLHKAQYKSLRTSAFHPRTWPLLQAR